MKKVFIGAVVAAAALVVAGSISSIAQAPRPASVIEQPVSVLFVGDLMLDRAVARRARAEGVQALLGSTTELFAAADLRVANLEGTITTNPSIAERDNTVLRFTFAPALAREALEFLRLDAVSLANNHALDFYDRGYRATLEYLTEWGVAAFGHPLNATGTLSTMLTVRGKTICLVGYHELFDEDTTAVLAEIQNLRPLCWRLVVMPHWGVEYAPTPSTSQVEKAHAFIDAGADLVVGAHPHVVQPHEVYRGKAILYSLGNFLFDQDFSYETRHSMAVRVDFSASSTRFVLTPLEVLYSHVGPWGVVAEFSLP